MPANLSCITPTLPLILASTSPYRQTLLARLCIPFTCAAPKVDETPFAQETAAQTSLRLAIEKAQAVAGDYPEALIIGSDQVALLNGQQLGKPITHTRAVAQLQAMRGQAVQFFTALCLYNSATQRVQSTTEIVTITMREYSDADIEAYLRKEQPYDCAGSAKSEGLGIVLMEKFQGNDPNALIGLPLIALVTMLKNENYPLLA